jgi:FdhE protein
MFESVEKEEKYAVRKIAELRKKPHIPSRLLDLVEQVWDIQVKALHQALIPKVLPEDMTPLDRVIQGAPLLPRERFGHDTEQAAELYTLFLDILEGMEGPMAQAARTLREQGGPLMGEAFAAYMEGNETLFADFAQRVPLAPRTLSFLAQSSLTPSVMAVAMSMAEALPADRTWNQATCPVCGSLALHSQLVGKEGVRMHTCSFCRAAYRTVRLQCPFCQERDAAKLPFFTADEEPGYRVDVCLSCKGYIKTSDFREFDRISLPVLDDLESMALDILAVKRGFFRPTPSAWGF